MKTINLRVLSVACLCIMHSVWSQDHNGNLPVNDLDTTEHIQPVVKRNASVDPFDFMSRIIIRGKCFP